MGFWAYYSPSWLGFLFALLMHDQIRAAHPTLGGGVFAAVLVGYGFTLGAFGQLMFIGLQGVAAQVLPVPRGRSIRGGPAALCGYLVLIFGVAAIVTAVLFKASATQGTIISGSVCGLVGLAALLHYVWNSVTAVRDFDAGK